MFTLEGYELTEIVYDDPCFLICYAWSAHSSRKVLLKVVKDGNRTLTENGKLLNEYKVASSLKMDGILAPTAAIMHSSGMALEFEPIQGHTLRRYAELLPISMGDLLNISIRLTEIIQELHDNHVLHLNIRPDTVLIQETTLKVYLTGFGYASRAVDGKWQDSSIPLMESSPYYMSPEQTGRMNQGVGARSDLYSLGVTLYEQLAGRLPYAAKDALGWSHAHMAQSPAPLPGSHGRIPQRLADIVMRLLAKDPAERFGSAAEVRAALQAVAADELCAPSEPVPGQAALHAGDHGARRVEAAQALRAGTSPRELQAGAVNPAGSRAVRPVTERTDASPSAGQRRDGNKPSVQAHGAAAVTLEQSASYSQVLDLSAIIQSSQAFTLGGSGAAMAAKLMTLLLQTAGAERALLVKARGGERVRILSAVSSAGEIVVSGIVKRLAGDPSLDEELLADCINGARPILLSEEARGSRLALPLIAGGQPVGCLYLENKLNRRAFAAERYPVLQTLGVQALYLARQSCDATPVIPPGMQVQAVTHSMETLTAREKEVLQLMAAGLSNQEIASRLIISTATVKIHVKNIFRKMKVDRRIKAVTIAKFLGLLDEGAPA
ncbi:protein kinase domain-containing protein [Paenibacillus lutrae]|uniref:non-specific serine/threonine protein kinase n=1 Tax=Paenibacillus lutrae TaxID=2078573 RepID=A0A7X3FJE1_9BACL|nr:LuxR C-terminal-related transcriptional regulator [Paenibacillus lutrae]MVP00589.1 protein kinase [Paenibacillus lutrae]